MQPFDAIHSPLSGTCLIEAGAGTGKTYTITTLVLRLILQEALLPDQILVLTFTTAATAELRDRIRRRLRDARMELKGQSPGDGDLEELLRHCRSREVALERLEDALANFDRMPVFTIHGFCQRILIEMAFETGSGFDAELVTDTTSIVQGLADDFWRQTWYQSPPELIALAWKTMKNPDSLAESYRRYAIPGLKILPDLADLAPVSYGVFRERCAATRRQWPRYRDEIIPLLYTPSLKANIYGSLDRPAGGGGSGNQRIEKIQSWVRLIDRWASPSAMGYPLPEALAYFTQTKLQASLKKGTQGPQHVFFEGCDHLWEEARRMETGMQQWLIALHGRFFSFIDEELKRYKRDKQVLFYDDLLLMVRQALNQDVGGPLAHMLQTRYRAALIDEFQDTDAIQYDIFATLFGGGGQPMFMIGDPKQAIYSFRGADIFTYLQAARSAARRFTLTQNWRSTPGMVQAVNTLFSQNPHPFVWPEIRFQPATAAATKMPLPMMDDRPSPLTIWFLDNPVVTKGRATLNKKTATEKICDALAQEVLRLVKPSPQGKGGVVFNDMAILVRTNRQAREIKNGFAAANIPAVVYNAGSVFHQPEALDLQRVLEAVADPGAEKKFRTALTTPFFERQGADLDFGEQAPTWWEGMLDRFFQYREIWIEGGFIRMFRQLMVKERIAAHLLAGPSGERYLTNILHLAELLHQVSVERCMGMGELVQWLEVQRRQGSDTDDAHQTRLESDDDAVTILTIHKSKGLEFPIVFCPFIWEGLGRLTPPALFHDDRHTGQRILDLGSDDIEQNLARMAEERMAEELRLLYVAVTRAKIQCYLVWGRLPSAEYSAFAYLMHYVQDRRADNRFWDNLQSMARIFLSRDSDRHRQDATDLAQRSCGAVTVIDMPQKAVLASGQTGPPISKGKPRVFSRERMPAWKIASFSSMIHTRHDDAEIFDDPLDGEDSPSRLYQTAGIDDASSSIGNIGQFEASARAGLFFHEILEQIDYTASTPASWSALIEDRMQHYGFDLRWQDTIADMLHRVVSTPLIKKPGESFALRQVPRKHRLSEIEFHLPLCAVDAAALSRAFSACRQPAFQGKLPNLLKQLDFKISGGYLKGYIDLILRVDGRYFIADWKSNHLGDAFENYRPSPLTEAMESHFYFLQYHIYTLALDQYLRACRPDYSYTRDFGGVFYLFIRGMGSPADPSTGIFFDCPAPELIRDLRRTLLVAPS